MPRLVRTGHVAGFVLRPERVATLERRLAEADVNQRNELVVGHADRLRGMPGMRERAIANEWIRFRIEEGNRRRALETSRQHVIDVVRLAAAKVRRGGRVIVETVNPTSLYTYAHAFWVDPDHVRPVHPAFLRFLFAEAGFPSVELVERSPVPDDESLELLPGDDELVKRLNLNFERINGLLFGPQDYAVVATR